jgi:hypothetical protein
VAEDWRVTFTIGEPESGSLSRALTALHENELEQDARDRLAGPVAVSRDDDHLFLYADTEAAATEAERIVAGLFAEHHISVEDAVALDRWHPLEERWEDARVAMPSSDLEQAVEHERREQDEKEESEETGDADWEVRVEFASHHDASAFADRLEQQGWPVVRRWKYVIVGADDEDDAHELAGSLGQDLPTGAQVLVEPGGGPVWEVMGNNRFAFLGGLGG